MYCHPKTDLRLRPLLKCSSGQSKSLTYNEWEHQKRGTSWKQKIRLEIDRLIASVKNIDELLYELELLGYTVKRGKYISIKAPEQQRFVRTKTLGEDYTAESIASRILWRDVGANVTLSGEPAPIRDDYIRTINDVSQLARDGKKIQRKRDKTASYSPENDMDVYKLSAQLTIINRDNIHSIGELEGKIENLKCEYENARQELNSLTVQQDKFDSLVEQAETYFSIVDKPQISIAERLQLNICKQTLKSNNIQTHSDFGHLKVLQQETDKKIAALNNSFKNCKRLYDTYSDITHTYREISKGDYISKLVAEEQKKKKKSI